MHFVDEDAVEIHCKVVYWGPPLSGRSTSMARIHAHAAPDRRTPLALVETRAERALRCTVLAGPETADGLALRLHLYCVPGAAFYADVPDRVLRGASGVIFVADSQVERLAANAAALDSLRSALRAHGRSPDAVPMVFQYNKIDLPHAVAVEVLDELLAPRWPRVPSVASKGIGVAEAFETMARAIAAAVRTPTGSRLEADFDPQATWRRGVALGLIDQALTAWHPEWHEDPRVADALDWPPKPPPG